MTLDARFSSLEPNPSRPLGLVLSGGGARGAFQVGVWEILSSDPRGLHQLPLVISGTSAGALNGALIAAGLSPQAMLQFWLDLAHDPPVQANEIFFRSLFTGLLDLAFKEPIRKPYLRARELRIFWRSLKKHSLLRQSGVSALLLEFLMTARFDSISLLLESIKTSFLFDTSALRERLHAAIGRDTIDSSRVRLAINTVNIQTGQVVRIVNAPLSKQQEASRHYMYKPHITLDMVMASAAIPLVFNPIEVEGMQLWDGGLLVNTPLAPTVALGAKRVIPVLVTVEDHGKQGLKHFGATIESLADAFLENAYNIDRKLLLERNTLAEHVPDLGLHKVDLFRAIRPEKGDAFNAGSYLYFEKKAIVAMYQAGKDAALRWLSQGPRLDHLDYE